MSHTRFIHLFILKYVISIVSIKLCHCIRIVNASFFYQTSEGAPAGPNQSHIDAIKKYGERGGIVITSGGNAGNDNDITPQYPAGYADYDGIDNVISVGSIDDEDNKASFSNYGVNSISIYAPSVDILSTYPESFGATEAGFDPGYAFKNGTSFSAPFVTGVAALLLSLHPSLSVTQIKDIILDSADSITITVGDGVSQTVKKLNAQNAVKQLFSSINISQFSGFKICEVTATSSRYTFRNVVRKLVVETEREYGITTFSNSPIYVELYDNNFNTMNISKTYSNSDQRCAFTKTFSPGEYYIKVYYRDETDSGNITISFTGGVHTHGYDTWKYYDYKRHKAYCSECEIWGTQMTGHWIYGSEIVNNRANCQGCHYVLDLNYDFANSIMGSSYVKQVTLNGSYILPSGTVVLVEEDVLAYLNGTLTFYDEDSLPYAA